MAATMSSARKATIHHRQRLYHIIARTDRDERFANDEVDVSQVDSSIEQYNHTADQDNHSRHFIDLSYGFRFRCAHSSTVSVSIPLAALNVLLLFHDTPIPSPKTI